jgi:hypothetical protein
LIEYLYSFYGGHGGLCGRFMRTPFAVSFVEKVCNDGSDDRGTNHPSDHCLVERTTPAMVGMREINMPYRLSLSRLR